MAVLGTPSGASYVQLPATPVAAMPPVWGAASNGARVGLCCSENDTLCDPDGSKLLYARSKVREAPALSSHWPPLLSHCGFIPVDQGQDLQGGQPHVACLGG